MSLTTNVGELPRCTQKAMHSITDIHRRHRRLQEENISIGRQASTHTRGGMPTIYFLAE